MLYQDSIWPSDFQKNQETETYHKNLKSNEVKDLINEGNFVKIFKRLPKGDIGWRHKQHMIELMEEYAFPKPMPEDIFKKYHIESDQAYLILATAETGTPLTCLFHIY